MINDRDAQQRMVAIAEIEELGRNVSGPLILADRVELMKMGVAFRRTVFKAQYAKSSFSIPGDFPPELEEAESLDAISVGWEGVNPDQLEGGPMGEHSVALWNIRSY